MGFELSLNDILVERLISLFPDIDTFGPYASFVRRHGRLPDDGDLQGGFYDVRVAAVCKCLLLPERKEYGAAGW